MKSRPAYAHLVKEATEAQRLGGERERGWAGLAWGWRDPAGLRGMPLQGSKRQSREPPLCSRHANCAAPTPTRAGAVSAAQPVAAVARRRWGWWIVEGRRLSWSGWAVNPPESLVHRLLPGELPGAQAGGAQAAGECPAPEVERAAETQSQSARLSLEKVREAGPSVGAVGNGTEWHPWTDASPVGHPSLPGSCSFFQAPWFPLTAGGLFRREGDGNHLWNLFVLSLCADLLSSPRPSIPRCVLMVPWFRVPPSPVVITGADPGV